jgi:hypothetical protein
LPAAIAAAIQVALRPAQHVAQYDGVIAARFVVDALDLNVAYGRDLVRGPELVQITGG